MGYRSDGRWVIKGPAEHINAAWALCRLNITAPASYDTEYEGGLYSVLKNYYVGDVGYIRLDYQNLKWYESYDDVKFFEAIWSLLADYAEENPDTIYGKRIRIGEDDSDVEIESFSERSAYVDIYLNRSVQDDEPTEGHAFKHQEQPCENFSTESLSATS